MTRACARPIARAAFGVLLLLLAGCAIKPIPVTDPTGPGGRWITTEEIARTGADNAWAVVTRLHLPGSRPGSARRGSALSGSGIQASGRVLLILDGLRIGDPGVLTQIPSSSIARIRYLNGIDATTRYGTGAGLGAIEIQTHAGWIRR